MFVPATAVVWIALASCDKEQALHHRKLATALYQSGQLTLATKELEQAVAQCREDAFSHFMLANGLYRENRLSEAKASYQAVVERQPGYFESRMSLGFTLFELGEKAAAMQEWLYAMRLDSGSAFARAALAVGLAGVDDIGNALMQYERAVSIDKRYADRKWLATDIRWKKQAVETLDRLSELYRRQQQQQ